MTKLFISHSSQDDAFVRALRALLADQSKDGWIDSCELRGGDPLWSEIQQAIEDASAYAIVVSTDSFTVQVGRKGTTARPWGAEGAR
jgi:nucleotide-binding universal stress UspA family protein